MRVLRLRFCLIHISNQQEPVCRKVAGIHDMNAYPLKNGRTPGEVIDDLIADYGFRKVLFALAGRIIKRTRPPDTLPAPRLADQRGVDRLDDHVRRDIGLPPKERPNPLFLTQVYNSRDFL